MIYRFAEFELDSGKFELRRQGRVVAAEPQVLALLLLLAENAERMVSKDEIVEKVWNGRIVSDAAISSRIKSARAALGDDGTAQRLIRTVHGRGFRFAVPVTPLAAPSSAAPVESAAAPAPTDTRPSIAVLPFTLLGDAGAYAAVADALPHELIAALSRLRWLFVIARGSSFRFRGAEPDLASIGAALGARYCLSGLIEVAAGKIAVTVELADTATGGVVWGERHAEDLDGVHEIRARIVASIVAALDLRIPLAEAERARLVAPERLDAWAAYHLGLDRMLRFNRADNAAAAGTSRGRWTASPISPGPTPGSPSPISRTPSSTIPAATRPSWRRRGSGRNRRWPAIRSIPSSTRRWPGRTGSRAMSTAASPGASGRWRSARTTRKGPMSTASPRRLPATAGRARATSAWRCG